jgi:hypothetical protein
VDFGLEHLSYEAAVFLRAISSMTEICDDVLGEKGTWNVVTAEHKNCLLGIADFHQSLLF